jgi:hypothetical protein
MLEYSGVRGLGEARKIFALMILWLFWDEDYMEIDINRMHCTAVAFALDELRKRRLPGFDDMFSFNPETRHFDELDQLFKHLAYRVFEGAEEVRDPIITIEGNLIRFDMNTMRLIRSELASDPNPVTGAEKQVLFECCRAGVKAYTAEMRFYGCE